MTANRNLALNVRVTGLDGLSKLESIVQSLRTGAAPLGHALQQAGASARTTSAEFAQMAATVKAGFAGLQTAITGLSASVAEIGGTLAHAAAQTNRNLGTLASDTRAATGELERHRAAADATARSYGTLNPLLRGLAIGMGAFGGASIGSGITTSLREPINQFSAFQQQLTFIQALSGESAQSINTLSAAALDVGKGVTGPQQLVEGLRILTQAGLSAKNALDVLPTVSGFAKISELDPRRAAESLIGISTAFGKSTSDASLAGTADVIAKAAAMSQTSVQGMTAAMRLASVVSEQFGARMEDVGAILATLAKRNIDFTSAGTAMRNAFQEIYAPSNAAKKALHDLGVEAYDSTGKMKPFLEVLEDFKNRLGGLTQKAQNEFLGVIGGERGGKVFSAMLQDMNAARGIAQQLAESFGFAAQASAVLASSLENRFKVAGNTLSSTFIQAGSAAEEPLRRLAATAQQAFGSGALKTAIGSTVSGLASLADILLRNVDAVGAVLIGTLGVRAVAALGALTSGLFGAATGATALGAASAGLMTVIAPWARAIALATAALLLLKNAFDGARKARDDFSSQGSKDLASELERITEQARKREADARARMNGNPLAGDSTLTGFDQLIERHEQERASKLAKIHEEATQRIEAGFANAGQSREVQAARERALAARQAMTQKEAASINAHFDKLIETTKTRREEFIRAEKGARAAEEQERAQRAAVSGEGTKPKEVSLRSAAAQASSAGRLFSIDFGQMEKEYRSAEQILRDMKDARLINEEAMNAELQRLGDQRLKEETDRTHQYLDELSAAYEKAKALTAHKLRGPDDRARLGSELEALSTDYYTRREAALSKLEEAQQAAAERRTRENLQQIKAAAEREDAIRNLITRKSAEDDEEVRRGGVADESVGRKWRIDEERRQLEANIELLPEVERRVATARLQVQADFRERWRAAEQQGNAEVLSNLGAYYKETVKIAEEAARKRAEHERDGLEGARRGLRAYADEAENMGRNMQNAAGSLGRGLEDLLISPWKAGKLEVRSFVNTVLEELSRLMIRKQIVGPLMSAFSGWLGGAGAVASVMHSGGLVGAAGIDRKVPAYVFAGAQRYHSGGTVLGADEVPIIAERGERVLSRKEVQAAQMSLGGGAGAKGATTHVQVNVVKNGTAMAVQEVQGQQVAPDRIIVRVVLDDLKRGGPIARGVRTVTGT